MQEREGRFNPCKLLNKEMNKKAKNKKIFTI